MAIHARGIETKEQVLMWVTPVVLTATALWGIIAWGKANPDFRNFYLNLIPNPSFLPAEKPAERNQRLNFRPSKINSSYFQDLGTIDETVVKIETPIICVPENDTQVCN